MFKTKTKEEFNFKTKQILSQELKSYFDVEDKESHSNFQKGSFKKILSEIMNYPLMFWSGVSFTLLSTFFFVIQPKVLAYIIDEIIIKKKESLLFTFILIFIGFELLRVCCTFFQEYIFNLLGQKVMQNLRVKIFTHIQSLPVSVFDQIPAGKLVTRVTNDVASLSDMFTSGFISIFGSVLLIVSLIGAIFFVDVKMGWIILGIFPGIVLVSYIFTERLKVSYRDARSKLSALNAFLVENISGIKIVHIFNRKKEHLLRFKKLNIGYTHAHIATVKVFSFFQPMITIFTGLCMALVIWFGGTAVSEGQITIGAFTMLTTYTISIFKPIKDMADRWNMFLSGMASAERIFSILNWKTEPQFELIEKGQDPSPKKIDGKIEFKNVWFAYKGENWILKDLNLTIQKGERIGIVGPTGSGKSTLIQLLLRFYEPTRGEIFMDGVPLHHWEKRALRQHFGLIQQDVFLFSGSVLENIHLWKDVASKSFHIENEILEKFPEVAHELLKVVQERGVNLSLGQRQVLSFLRAAYHQPDIWIMDEASAFMDSESELKLEEVFRKQSLGKTTLTIAHRLSSVKNSDQIIVLCNGRIIEKGRHQELIRKNGLYHKLYSYQQNVDTVGLMS